MREAKCYITKKVKRNLELKEREKRYGKRCLISKHFDHKLFEEDRKKAEEKNKSRVKKSAKSNKKLITKQKVI